MSKNILVVFAALALLLAGPIACKKGGQGGDDASNNIVGTWSVDVDETVSALSEEEREQARAMMAMMGGLTMTFTDEGTVTMSMGDSDQSASYEVTSSEDDTLQVTMTTDGGDATNVVVTFISEDQLRIEPAEGEGNSSETMVLNRVE